LTQYIEETNIFDILIPQHGIAHTNTRIKRLNMLNLFPGITLHHPQRPRLVSALIAAGLLHAPAFAAPHVSNALEEAQLGLLPAQAFRLTTGQCTDCPTVKQGLWYFQQETIAVPKTGASGFDRRLSAQQDVQQWAQTRQGQPEGSHPPLLWLGSPQVARGTLGADGNTLQQGNSALPLTLVEKIPSNLSYYNADSLRFFAGRSLKARGQLKNGQFTARTLWPEDFNLAHAAAPKPLQASETLEQLVRTSSSQVKQPKQPSQSAQQLQTRTLWSRSGEAVSLAGKPVLAMILNGAQGDDDEAHGGHFAIATGKFGPRGEWDSWLVNNFYNLDSQSEKGILAATLPLDSYQADLNSGQSWYRPSDLLVAVLRQERSPALYQEAISRVFNHFYRHDFHYRHASANCAGLSLETLRSLGWQVPLQGSTSRLKAIAALPYMTLKDRSLDSGRKAYDYLVAEKTSLYPFVAFTAAGNDLLQRLSQAPRQADRSRTPYETMLADDLEALVYIHLPQFPSSRAQGQAPIASLDEYMSRVPEDKSQWKIIPAPPRAFPDALKDPEAPAEAGLPSDTAVTVYGIILAVLALLLGRKLWQQRKQHR
jgi:hypothetical protein